MSAAKNLGRRLFARAAVGVPTALSLGAAKNLPPPSLGYPSQTAQGGLNAYAPLNAAKQSLVQKVWEALHTGMKPQQEQEQLRYVRRNMMGGLDPDLSVLNSMSLQRRVQIQIDREKAAREADRSLRHRIIKGLGGNPEEFE